MPVSKSSFQSANLSAAGRAKCSASWRWDAASTLRMNWRPAINASAPRASSRILHKISGGSSDTDANELIVIPSHLPSVDTVVTRQTPVGKVPSDCRNERASVVTGVSPVMRVHEYMAVGVQY